MTHQHGLILLFGLLAGNAGAQAAPSGATGLCKDGTYSNAPKKSGACSGHKGVQTWYAAAGASPAATRQPTTQVVAPPAVPAAPPQRAPDKPAEVTPHSSPAASTRAINKPQTAGGGPGMVWVNTASKTYHCQGSAYYGKTKQGKYVSEADAKAEGDHADHGKACTK